MQHAGTSEADTPDCVATIYDDLFMTPTFGIPKILRHTPPTYQSCQTPLLYLRYNKMKGNKMKSISVTSKLSDGLEVPFIYEIDSIQKALEIIQNTIELGAEISEVVIK